MNSNNLRVKVNVTLGDLSRYVELDENGFYVYVKPRGYIPRKQFNSIGNIVRRFGGNWDVLWNNWKIPKHRYLGTVDLEKIAEKLIQRYL